MNESYAVELKSRRPWFIAFGVLLAWAIGATIAGVHFNGKYKSLESTVAAANGGELLESIQQHGENIVSVHDDIVAIRTELESAVERAEYAEGRIKRAYDIAEQSDVEFVDFRNTMAVSGGTIQEAIQLQQRTIELVGRIESNNSAIKVELGMRP